VASAECVSPQSVAADSRGVEVRTVELVIREVRFDVFHHWEPWAGVVAATWSVIAGIAVKRGRMRRVAAMSLNHENPWWWRNTPFALLP
jgi:hypothetical protein